MSLTIVIPAKNEEKNLAKLLADIKKQSVQPQTIIIADAASTDGTAAVAKKHGCKVVPGGLPGIGRNTGARGVKTDYIIFFDADVRLDEHFIRDSLNEMKRRELDAATVNNLPGWTGQENTLQRAYLHFMHAATNLIIRFMATTRGPGAIGTCIIFRTEVFHELKGFNEKILWEEDTEITERAAQRGYSFGMLHTSVIASTRRIIDQGYVRFYYNAIKLYFYRKRHGEITSWKTYKKLTGRDDYFTFLKFRA